MPQKKRTTTKKTTRKRASRKAPAKRSAGKRVPCDVCPIGKRTGKPSGLKDRYTLCEACEGSGTVVQSRR